MERIWIGWRRAGQVEGLNTVVWRDSIGANLKAKKGPEHQLKGASRARILESRDHGLLKGKVR